VRGGAAARRRGGAAARRRGGAMERPHLHLTLATARDGQFAIAAQGSHRVLVARDAHHGRGVGNGKQTQLDARAAA
jgi:hypothetical protein